MCIIARLPDCPTARLPDHSQKMPSAFFVLEFADFYYNWRGFCRSLVLFWHSFKIITSRRERVKNLHFSNEDAPPDFSPGVMFYIYCRTLACPKKKLAEGAFSRFLLKTGFAYGRLSALYGAWRQ
jgi:hypothetical protein